MKRELSVLIEELSLLIEILIALEFFNHLFCTGLVKLVPAKHIHDKSITKLCAFLRPQFGQSGKT